VEFNLADLFEATADAFPDREYLVAEGKRRTYAEMEGRANQLAHHLTKDGVRAGDHVGIYAYNSVEWVETLWAVFKIRASGSTSTTATSKTNWPTSCHDQGTGGLSGTHG
jgi:acyl-CoA synthetase (AMP-forming)/AMP-acid ligase II